MATHTREMNEKEAQLKTNNGKLIASERQAEKLRDTWGSAGPKRRGRRHS